MPIEMKWMLIVKLWSNDWNKIFLSDWVEKKDPYLTWEKRSAHKTYVQLTSTFCTNVRDFKIVSSISKLCCLVHSSFLASQNTNLLVLFSLLFFFCKVLTHSNLSTKISQQARILCSHISKIFFRFFISFSFHFHFIFISNMKIHPKKIFGYLSGEYSTPNRSPLLDLCLQELWNLHEL